MRTSVSTVVGVGRSANFAAAVSNCHVCAIVIAPGTPQRPPRGLPLLVLGGAAGAGTGAGAVDLAKVVHAAARHARGPLALHLDAGVDNAVLMAHLVTTQALCRAQSMAVAWPPRETLAPAARAWVSWANTTLRFGAFRLSSGGCNTRASLVAPVEAAPLRELPTCPDRSVDSRWAATPTRVDVASPIDAAVDALFAKSNCTHAYLDVGTNIGVQIRKLYEPHLYPKANVLPEFARHFGELRCRVCAIGLEPNPRHEARLQKLERRLSRVGAPILVLRAAAGTVEGAMQLHMHRDVPDAWKDVGASGAASQGGASTTAVAVRTIDLAALVRRVSGWVKSRGGKLLAKLDIEGSEYTVAPHLALDGALCLIDTVMIEWHQRYYGHSNLFRVSKLLNLSARTSGYGVAISWTGGTPRALAAAAAACPTATVVSEIDDETYLHDLQPWPLRDTPLCAGVSAPRAARPWVATAAQRVYDEFEDDGLLWLLWLLGVALLCACAALCAVLRMEFGEEYFVPLV